MTKINETVEMRGMPREELVDYFVSIGGQHVKGGRYVGRQWAVNIDEQKFCTLGSIKIPSTKITFSIEEEISEVMLYKFRLKFLSAGA